MSNALVETLAERLSRSSQETDQRLQHFVSDLKKQLAQQEEVTIPNVGVFRSSGDGITFTAAEPLTQAVNHQFAGLDPVRVPPPESSPSSQEDAPQRTMADEQISAGSSKDRPDNTDSAEEESDAPHDLSDLIMDEIGGHSHREQEEEEGEQASQSSPANLADLNQEDSEAFAPAPPSEADDASTTSIGKEQETAPSSSSSPDEEKEPSTEPTLNQTFAENEQDVPSPDRPDTDRRAADEEANEEADVEDEYAEAGAATPSSVGPDQAPEPDPMPKASPEKSEERATTEDTATHAPDDVADESASAGSGLSAAAQSAASKRQAAREESSNSSLLVIAGLIILVVLGVGVYYYLQTQQDAGAPSEQPVAQSSSAPSSNSTGQAPASVSAAGNAASNVTLPTYQLPAGLNASEGGWTMIVASETSRRAAKTTLRRYAEWLGGNDLPLGIVQGEAGGVTRYRIGVGQSGSRSELQSALRPLQDRLPGGAWPLQLSQ